jgi:hypothetical protein
MSIAGVLALPPTESCSSLFGGLESICCLVVQNVLHCAMILNHNKRIITLSPQNLLFEAIVVGVSLEFLNFSFDNTENSFVFLDCSFFYCC